jgi:flagellar hook protein FlgE
MLQPLNTQVAPNTHRFSNSFKIASTYSASKIIDENGNEKLLKVKFIQTKPQTGTGSIWQTNVEIKNSSDLSEGSDLKDILLRGNSINLKKHQDLWLSIGNANLEKTALGYNYIFEAPSLLSKNTNSNISFEVNGKKIEITLNANSSQTDNAYTIVNALKSVGIDANAVDKTVKILSDINSKTLNISNYQGDIDNFSLPKHSLEYLQYNDDFTTAKDFQSIFNKAAQNANISLKLDNIDSNFHFQNNETTPILFKFLEATDSNKEFLNLITPTNEPTQPNSSVSTNNIDTLKTISNSTNNLTFDKTSTLTGDTSFSIKNGSKDLTIDLSGITNLKENLYNEYFSQNGEASSHLENYNILDSGEIVANFQNGKSASIAQVALFQFQNEQGLDKIGSNLFIRSQNSGDPFFYSENNLYSTKDSAIKNQMLESSNVTTANALTQMIVIQRAFEGTAKIITTSNELLKNAINMKK